MTDAQDLRTRLLALADRCEREEPSRALDVRIYQAAMGIKDEWDADFGADDEYGTARRESGWFNGTVDGRCDWHPTPTFTTSLDAAVTLEPADAQEIVVRKYRNGGIYIRLTTSKDEPIYLERFAADPPITETMARLSMYLRARAAVQS
jgi:hypothetical protein